MQLDKQALGYILALIGAILILVLGVTKIIINQQGEKMCSIIADDPDLDMEDCPAHDASTSWLLLLAFGIAFITLGIGGYLLLRVQEEKPKTVNTSKLSAKEANVYNLLRENKGSMYQSDLVQETGFSKVKMTRTLDKLERKDILERKRRGMTNLVVLK